MARTGQSRQGEAVPGICPDDVSALSLSEEDLLKPLAYPNEITTLV